jgi:predicted DNA-binding transcriptional regulator AlpA
MMENQIGFFRLPQVLEIYPVSKSDWWAGCKQGRYPAPIKLSARTTAWRKSDIFALVEKMSGGKADE